MNKNNALGIYLGAFLFRGSAEGTAAGGEFFKRGRKVLS
jgi:hypothetical protein